MYMRINIYTYTRERGVEKRTTEKNGVKNLSTTSS